MHMVHRQDLEHLRMARFWQEGVPPVAGGYLDQPAEIVSRCDWIWRERKAWRRWPKT